MKQHILELLSDAIPLVDFNSDFLFTQLDSLSVINILMLLEHEYQVPFNATDASPKNLKSIDSIVSMVERKLADSHQ